MTGYVAEFEHFDTVGLVDPTQFCRAGFGLRSGSGRPSQRAVAIVVDLLRSRDRVDASKQCGAVRTRLALRNHAQIVPISSSKDPPRSRQPSPP